MKLFFCIISVIGFVSCKPSANETIVSKLGEMEINWQDTLAGDFSFQNNWSYPDNVFKNEFNQLSCDGICPPEIDKMKNEQGKIYKDSMNSFYKLIDTTHQFHTIQCEAWCYEWAGTDFITVEKLSKDTIICYTQMNASTHCSLHFLLVKNKCLPTIVLTSISKTGSYIYNCKEGSISIDSTLFTKGILKAIIDFKFKHDENLEREMYWKGKIYGVITK
jgi:hypothetical protein